MVVGFDSLHSHLYYYVKTSLGQYVAIYYAHEIQVYMLACLIYESQVQTLSQ